MPGSDLDPLHDCKVVLCLPAGDGDTLLALRERRVPAVGLDADAAAVQRCRARGLAAHAGSPAVLRGHRHKFDGGLVELGAVAAGACDGLAAALDEALMPGARLVVRGEPAPLAACLPGFAVVSSTSGGVLLQKPRAAAAPPSPGLVVGPYADLFVGCKRVLELGAGRGVFLDALRLRELDCLGIEHGADLAAAARARGHDVHHGGTDLLAELLPGCDGVFLGNALESVPVAALAALVATLRAGLPGRSRVVLRGERDLLRTRVQRTIDGRGWTAVHLGQAPHDARDALLLLLADTAPPLPAAPPPPMVLTARGLPIDGPVRSPFDLERCERRVHSQGGEDGVLEALFGLLGTTNRCYVEFGCGDGLQCNTAALRRAGWQGLLLDGACAPGASDAVIHAAWITAENIEALFDEHGVPAEPDLMSIDLDGNDYWVWRAIRRRPRVVVAEYNANLAADRALTIPYDPQHRWDGGDFYGASLLALVQLGREKGYTLVLCTQAGVNAVFVRDDVLGAPAVDPAALWRPPNYWYRGARSFPDLSRAPVPV